MKKKYVIDIYSGAKYDKRRHMAREGFWSDSRFLYWGWLYDSTGEIAGDWTAQTMQDAEKALGVKFRGVS